MTATDKLGQEIKVGHYIAYGHAMGRSAGLRIGRVHAIKHTPKERMYHGDSGWRITVQGVDDDWNHRKPELCKRMGTLLFPDRVIVLDVRHIPEQHLALLSDSTD